MKRFLFLSQIILFATPALATVASEIRLTRIVQGLQVPVALVQPNDTASELFVAEARGIIHVIDREGTPRSEPFLDIRDRVIECCDNGGALLSLVFNPGFPVDHSFYVLYVDLAGDTVLSRFRTDAARSSGIASTEEILFVVDQPEEQVPNHHGGDLHFGPDGYLYVTIGDGGTETGVTERAQDLGNFLGKALRIDVRDSPSYRIPADNPFSEVEGARPEIWAFGLRNPWRFSFDRGTGDLTIADVGEDLWEEVNIDNVLVTRGANYGWPRMEGRHCFRPESGCDDGSLLLPEIEYTRNDGCSVTGGYVYRGPSHALRGTYLYSDLCSGMIWGARRQSDGTWTSELLLDTDLQIISFGQDRGGNLYVLDYHGSVHLVEPPSPSRRRLVRRR